MRRARCPNGATAVPPLNHANSKGSQYDQLVAGTANSGALARYAFNKALGDDQQQFTSCGSTILDADAHGTNAAPTKSLHEIGHIKHAVKRIVVEQLYAPLSCIV